MGSGKSKCAMGKTSTHKALYEDEDNEALLEAAPMYREDAGPPPPIGMTAPEFAALWRIVTDDPARVLAELGAVVPTTRNCLGWARPASKAELVKHAKVELTMATPNLGYVTDWLEGAKECGKVVDRSPQIVALCTKQHEMLAPCGNVAEAVKRIHTVPLAELFLPAETAA